MSFKTSDTAILNLGDIGEENTFTSTITPSTGNTSSTVHSFEDKIPDSALDADDEGVTNSDDTVGLLDGENRKQVNYNFWSLSFYGQFFDVDDEDVRKRLAWSMFPRPSATTDFLRRSIRPKPDLYGPFWVCVTLIFSVAISGNVAAYLQTGINDVSFRWHYDFHKVTLAATAVFGYAWLVPATLYAVFWWLSGSKSIEERNSSSASFLELLCVYGYSLAIYIPVSVLWTIQYSALQWSLVLVGAGLSGAVLVLAIWPSVQNHTQKVGIILIGIVLLLHLLLACGFMLYFFHVPASSTQVIDSKSGEVGLNIPKDNINSDNSIKVSDSPNKIITKNNTSVDGQLAKQLNSDKAKDNQSKMKL